MLHQLLWLSLLLEVVNKDPRMASDHVDYSESVEGDKLAPSEWGVVLANLLSVPFQGPSQAAGGALGGIAALRAHSAAAGSKSTEPLVKFVGQGKNKIPAALAGILLGSALANKLTGRQRRN